MISKATFEQNNTNCNLANIVNINSRANKNALAPISSIEGNGITSSQEDDQVEYMDETSDETVVASSSSSGWIIITVKDPC